jgi:hypothetical protein
LILWLPGIPLTPYNFAFNGPAYWNDPTGADVLWGLYTREEYNRATMQRDQAWVRGGSAGDLIERFPEDFMFQMTNAELSNWRGQFGIANNNTIANQKQP